MLEYLVLKSEYSDKFVTDKEDPDHPISTHLSNTQGC
jgi:hypothetical protein